MYSAQITGIAPEPDYIDQETMGELHAEEVAKEMAVFSHDWDPRDILAYGDVVSLAEALIKLKTPRSMPPNVTHFVAAALTEEGLHLSATLHHLLQPSIAPRAKSASLIVYSL